MCSASIKVEFSRLNSGSSSHSMDGLLSLSSNLPRPLQVFHITVLIFTPECPCQHCWILMQIQNNIFCSERGDGELAEVWAAVQPQQREKPVIWDSADRLWICFYTGREARKLRVGPLVHKTEVFLLEISRNVFKPPKRFTSSIFKIYLPELSQNICTTLMKCTKDYTFSRCKHH